jgi:hypothetical protein
LRRLEAELQSTRGAKSGSPPKRTSIRGSKR